MANHLKGGKNLFLVLLFIYLLLSIGFTFFRIVNIDEGLHLLSARELSDGRIPYRDFFFPQMPLILYLLSPFASRGLNGFFAARLLYAAFSILLGLSLFYYSQERTKDLKTSLLCFILYILNGFILSWHTVLQFNAPTDLLLFLAFWLSLKGKPICLFLSGFLLGIVIDLRIVFVPLLLLLFVWLLMNKTKENTLIWTAGLLLTNGFWLRYLFKHKSIFLFNILFSQLRRENLFLPIAHPILQKCSVLGKFLGFPQTGGIVLLAFLTMIYLRRKFTSFKPELLAFLIGTAIFFTYLIATPSMFHYFVQTLPFFLVTSLPYVERGLHKRSKLVWPLLFIYTIFIIIPIQLHILGMREHDKTWKVGNIKKAVSWIVNNSKEEEEIFSSWPGFPVLANRGILPDCRPWDKELARRFGERDRKRYSIPSNERIAESIREGKALVAIVTGEDSEEWEVGKVYSKVERFGEFIAYLLPSNELSSPRSQKFP